MNRASVAKSELKFLEYVDWRKRVCRRKTWRSNKRRDVAQEVSRRAFREALTARKEMKYAA